jgi:hypothetical protein
MIKKETYYNGQKFESNGIIIIAVEYIHILSDAESFVTRLPKENRTYSFHRLTKKGNADMRTNIAAPHKSYLKWNKI